MKIIREGKLPQDKEYKCTCQNCGTIFSFIQKEGEVVLDQREGNFIQIKCPLCNHICTISLTTPQRYDWYEDH